jgi:hypothetical protein
LFEEQTIARIRALDTGDYLYNSSERSKTRREPLPVLAPRDSLALLLAGSDYPVQPTSWSGAYHVLQRYGAYVALTRFTDVFDDRHAQCRPQRDDPASARADGARTGEPVPQRVSGALPPRGGHDLRPDAHLHGSTTSAIARRSDDGHPLRNARPRAAGVSSDGSPCRG